MLTMRKHTVSMLTRFLRLAIKGVFTSFEIIYFIDRVVKRSLGKMHRCNQCSKTYQQRQSLFRHKQICKSQPPNGKLGSGILYDYDLKPKLHNFIEAAGTDRSPESRDVDEKSCSGESFLEELDVDDNDDDVIRSSDEEVHERIDRKLWRIMSLKSYCNERCILPTFKYYVKLCQMLHHDELYKNLMKDVQNIGVEMDFNHALESVVKSNKDIILKTIAENAEGVDVEKYESKVSKEDDEETDSDDEEEEETDSESGDETSDNSDGKEYPCKSIWTILLEESLVDDVDILEVFKKYILLCQSLQDDDIYQVIMKVVDKAMNNKGLDFDDALDYAVEKEKELIFSARENARREAMLEGKTWAAMELI